MLCVIGFVVFKAQLSFAFVTSATRFGITTSQLEPPVVFSTVVVGDGHVNVGFCASVTTTLNVQVGALQGFVAVTVTTVVPSGNASPSPVPLPLSVTSPPRA